MVKYTVAADILVRKEFFGCLVIDSMRGKFFAYQDGVYEILKMLRKPMSEEELLQQLQEDYEVEKQELKEQFNELIERKILVESDISQPSTFFFDKGFNFRTDCLAMPSAVTIYLTNRCPKKCKHCVVGSAPDVDILGELSVGQWLQVLDLLRKAGVGRLVFTGGDPLIKKGVFDILQYADKLNFFISLLTDFDGLRQSHIDKLKRIKHLGYFQISLEGADEKTHDWMRGKGAFEKALKRMRLLKVNNVGFTLSVTVDKRNFSQLDAFADLALANGAAQLYFNPLAPYGRGLKLKDYLLDLDQLWLLAQKYLGLVKERGINPGNSFWERNLDHIGDKTFHPFKDALHAVSIAFYTLSIDAKGDVYLDSKMKVQKKLLLGNILQRLFKDMWYDPKLETLRKYYRSDRPAYIDEALVEL